MSYFVVELRLYLPFFRSVFDHFVSVSVSCKYIEIYIFYTLSAMLLNLGIHFLFIALMYVGSIWEIYFRHTPEEHSCNFAH